MLTNIRSGVVKSRHGPAADPTLQMLGDGGAMRGDSQAERWQPSKQMLLEQLYVNYIQELMGGAGVDLEAAVSCTKEWMLSTMESHVLPGSWSETMRRRSSRTVTLFPKPPFFLPSCGRFTLKANRIRLSTIHLVWCRKQFSVKLSPSEIDIMPSVSRCLQISSS